MWPFEHSKAHGSLTLTYVFCLPTPPGCSPKLSKVVEVLLPYEHGDGALCGIIFVKTRSSVRRVVNFLKTHPQLSSFVRPIAFCGKAEMSQQAQEKARHAFNTGEANILVATSVAYEGLNVQACNLGIMLDSVYTGKDLVQCRGRIRDAKGNFHVCALEATPESIGQMRSQQQHDAMEEALTQVAAGYVARFSRMNIDDPISWLNQKWQKGELVHQPEFTIVEATASYTVMSAKITLKSTGQCIQSGPVTAPNKNKAKQEAAKMMAAKLVEMLMG